MQKIDAAIWVHDTDFTFLGADFGNRMTIIRLAEGRLLVHSPVKLDRPLANAVRALGHVAYIVTPNNFHGLFAHEWLSEFPEATHYTAQADAEEAGAGKPLSALAEDLTGREIEIVKIEGAPKVNEYAFIHLASRSLILTDMAFNIGPSVSMWSKLFFTLNGALNRFGPTRLMRTMITDAQALEASMQKILSFDIERVIVSHGEILTHDAKNTLAKAFSPCYSTPPKQKRAKLSLSRCG